MEGLCLKDVSLLFLMVHQIEVVVSLKSSCIDCPDNELSIDGRLCVRECPFYKPFVFRCSCIDKCPPGFMKKRKRKVYFCSKENETYSTNVCIVNECIEPSPLCYNMRCLEKCPIFTVRYGNYCVIECLNDRPYIFQDMCVDNCPPDFPVLQYGECVANCSAGYILSGINCVWKCPLGQYIQDSRCVSHCDGFILQLNETTKCLKECPYLTVMRDNACDLHCPYNKPFLSNGICEERCPSIANFILKIKSPYTERVIMTCSESCPNYVSQNNLCTDSCQSNEVLYRNECRYQCPESDPYRTNINPLSPQTFTVNTSYAIKKPIRANAFCTMGCPIDFVLDVDGCFSHCLNSKRNKEFNGTCIDTCPENFPFTNIYNFKFICVSSCPKYRYNNSCFDHCPSQLNVYDGQCFDCKSLGKYLDYDKCVDTCPNVRFEGRCYDICPQESRFNFNNSCEKSCGSYLPVTNVEYVEHKYSRVNFNITCLDTCPTGKFKSNNTCVEFCSDSYEYNNTCVTECISPKPYSVTYIPSPDVFDVIRTMKSNFIYAYFGSSTILKKCVDSCRISRYKMTCVDVCPNGMVNLEGICVSECSGKYVFKNTHSCVDSCPKFVWNFTCYDACPPGTFLHKNSCVSECPISSRYNNKGKCVTSCPRYFNDLLTCIDTCPKTMYVDHMLCSENCPSNMSFYEIDFFNRKTCYSNCPESLLVTAKNECIYKFSCEFYAYEGRCLETCPSHTYASVVTTKPYECKDLTVVYVFSFVFGIFFILFLLAVARLLFQCLCSRTSKEELHDNDQTHLRFFDIEGHDTHLVAVENDRRRNNHRKYSVNNTNETIETNVYQQEQPVQTENNTIV